MANTEYATTFAVDLRTAKVRELFEKKAAGDGELVALWQRFEDVGNDARRQMISMVNGMFLFATGLFSYVIGVIYGIPGQANIPSDPGLALGAAFLGGATAFFALLLVIDFQGHAFRNWWRANNAKNAVERLHYLITDKLNPEPLESPRAFEPLDTRVTSIFKLYRGISILLMVTAAALFIIVLVTWGFVPGS